jgi:hypothetical protein
MSKHPYQNLPKHCFWRSAVTQTPPADVDPVVAPKFSISKTDRVATAGSCFAQHIARHLSSGGFNYFVSEKAHPHVPPHVANEFGYGLFTARYGNIYTSRQLLQLLRRVYGLFAPIDDMWVHDGGRRIDPFRPQIQPCGFSCEAEYWADREQHFAAVKRAVEQLDVFVFTLGLTEVWLAREDGAAYPLCPGVAGGNFDEMRHRFVNLRAADVVADMNAALGIIRSKNAKARFILTVSPVPLVATAADRSVLVSTTYSKSVLRVACEEVAADHDDVAYFPSYEIITGSFNRGRYFASDARSVTEEGVAHVMRLFMRHYASESLGRRADSGPMQDEPKRIGQANERADQDAVEDRRAIQEVVAVMCDEEQLDANAGYRRNSKTASAFEERSKAIDLQNPPRNTIKAAGTMPKTVLFYGNSQAQALFTLYQRQIAPQRGEAVFVVFPGGELAKPLSQADVVIEQVFDLHEPFSATDLKSGARLFRFPTVLGAFLWPYATQAHVQNARYSFLPSGPYPEELGDSYLNRLIGHIPLDDAVVQYRELDVPAQTHLDRLYDDNLSRQSERDRVSGIDVAALIDQNFRTEPMFTTRGHPTRRVFDHVASALFGCMGVPEDVTRIALGSYARSMFPWDELPVHPSVIAHYNLKYLATDSTYRYMVEGHFTFEEFIRRYLNYEWNPELYRGIHLSRRRDQDPMETLNLLEKGLAKSRPSVLGLRAKCELLVELGRIADARQAAASAVNADPEDPENYGMLASVMVHLDDFGHAEETLRRAIELQPLGAKFHAALASVLSRVGRNQEAVDAARFAVPLLPGDADIHSLLGLVLHRNGQLDDAAKEFRLAILRASEVDRYRYQSFLADVLRANERVGASTG